MAGASGRAPTTWQCKQEGQRPWQPGARSPAVCGGVGSFLPSPAALRAPATGGGGGVLGGAGHPLLWPARCHIHPAGLQMVSDSSHGPLPTPPTPQCCTRASPPPFRAFAGGEEPQRGQSAPFSQTGLCLPHGCADGSSVPVLDTVWSSPGDESGDRPVVPGAQEWTGGWAAPRTS